MKSKQAKRARPAKTVAVLDDDEAVCDSLAEIIESLEGWHCVETFYDPRTALRDLPGLAPDIVMVDIRMKQCSGIEVIRDLKRELPEARFLIVSALTKPAWIKMAVEVGAHGYLLKPWSSEEVAEALSKCAAGREYVSERGKVEWERAKEVVSPKAAVLLPELTRRQNEILALLQEAQPHKQMADDLGITEQTLDQHLQRIYRILGVSSQGEAIKYLRRRQGY